jgi:hypothetical protein
MKDTDLTAFYGGLIKKHNLTGYHYPYDIDEILNDWTDVEWESNHDFIQWLFPTSTKSRFNPDAPTLSEMEAFVLNEVFSDKIDAAVKRYKTHLLDRNLLNFRNHNWLRISRVIQSLREVNKPEAAEEFLAFCIANCDDTDVLQESLEFWENANKLPPLFEEEVDAPLVDEEIL